MAEVQGECRLQRVSILENVDTAVLAALDPHMKERSFPAHSMVYRTGAWADGLYAVMEGGVLLRTERPGLPVDRFLDLGPGDLFGESEALAGAPREQSARTVKPAKILFLPVAPLREVVGRYPFLETLLRALTARRRMSQTRARFISATRREPRIWIDREVVLTIGGTTRMPAHLEDLSFSGACFTGAPPHWQPGQQVRFTLGTAERPDLLRVSGEIRWQELGSVGVVFENSGPDLRQKVEQALRVLVP